MKKEDIQKSFKYKMKKLWDIIIPVIAYCGLTGIFVGILVGLFNYCATLLSDCSSKIYAMVYAHPGFIPLLFLGLVLLALAMGLLHKFVPQVRGSGIPQTEGVMRGIFTFKWFRILIATIVGSFISFFAGLSLGSEGPSVQIGATSSQGASKLLGSKMAWQRYIISGGAGAGLSVAFNAPLTGLIFVLEEGQRRFSPMILLSAGTSVIFGTMSYRLFGKLTGLWAENATLFAFGDFAAIPYTKVGVLLLIGLVCGIGAIFFNASLVRTQHFLDKYTKQLPYWLRLVVVFVITGVLGLTFSYANGGGHGLVEQVANMDFAISMLLLILLVKFIMIVLCYNTGATGGLFIPMLAIGALVGGILGHMFINFGWLEPMYYKAVVCVCMTTFFGASVRAPLTAVVLIVEITGYNSDFLATSIAIFTAFMIAEFIGSLPIYESMLNRFRAIENKGLIAKKELIDVEVPEKAFIINRAISDVLWPANSLVINVKRGEHNIVPDGETKIHKGDVLTIQAETIDVVETKIYLQSLIK